uniref:Uncharacterized protein n=1 Tax=Clastoptera arizonana TaxID=38151 RepID=A0A1B6CLJ3_9HEMI
MDTMEINEAENISLNFGDDIGDDLKLDDIPEYDTRSEVTSSSSETESSAPSISSVSSDSSLDHKGRGSRHAISRTRDKKSVTPESLHLIFCFNAIKSYIKSNFGSILNSNKHFRS